MGIGMINMLADLHSCDCFSAQIHCTGRIAKTTLVKVRLAKDRNKIKVVSACFN